MFYKNKNGCRFGDKCSFAHRQVDAQPTKWSKSKNDKSAVALLKKGDWHERESVTDRYHDRSGTQRDICGTVAISWWADSMECYCYLRNIQDFSSDWKTPYERRFGIPFNGPIIPFEAMVEYHPISVKDQSRLHQFGAKVLPGIFLGCAFCAGGIWKGDTMVADFEELEEMDASELHARRLEAKEVVTSMRGDNFIFPVADGTVNISGGDQRLRISTSMRDSPQENQTGRLIAG